MRGVSVTVYVPQGTVRGRFGNERDMYLPETVHDVLVEPGATESLEASRPDGAKVAYTLHFPKTYSGNLEGCYVELPEPWEAPMGRMYRVVGRPGQYMDANTPTRWHMPVEVEVAHG